MKLGYARVSTGEQDLSGQLEALRAAGCQRVYSEKKSGGNDNRAALQRMLKEVQPGDVVDRMFDEVQTSKGFCANRRVGTVHDRSPIANSIAPARMQTRALMPLRLCGN
jgi:resolvase-like protein